MFIRKPNSHKIEKVELLSELPDIDHEPRFKVEIVANEYITKDVFRLLISRPKDFTFIPGQYIWVVLPELTSQFGVVDRRAYSISSGQNDLMLELIIRDANSLYLSKLKKLKVGEEIEIIGPMGSAFVAPSSGFIMVAGGTGVSPFLSILKTGAKGDIDLILFSTSENSLKGKVGLDDLSDKYNILYKEAKPRSVDFKGVINKKDTRPVLISGSPVFVNLVTKILLRRGLSPKQIYYEENYPETTTYKKLNDVLIELSENRGRQDIRTVPGLGDLFLQVTKQASNHIVLTDRNGIILFANEAATEMTGYTFDEMKGQTPRLWGGLMSNETYKKIWDNLLKGVAVKQAVVNRRRNGDIYVSIATITPVLRRGKVIIFVATEDDITFLKNVDKAKTEFVSFASHQLRAPLSVVGWYSEMLLNGDAGKLSKEQTEYLNQINSSNKRMSELIGALLDVSRLELGTFVIEPEAVDFVKIVQGAIDEQKIEISKKKMHLNFSSSKNIPIIKNDPKLLHMVVQNLLSNSVKYTPNGGKLDLSLSMHDKKSILLKVADNGYGIPKDQQDKIFTKLFRADNVRLMKTDGTGLGLYIIKLVIEKSGGKIWFDSEENKGTTFYVKIPLVAKAKKKRLI